ncbi:hypothetical protein CROQUDRAFT_716373 [Cronartium quercuum f. sp. fusiforme G11]|uniref:Uncharacterized protein n=1 Tax=Cronartium quercuum f. sp. fusiforme G11 TaxID=708437 RepID=A0A9P6TAS4_9BASI|nr:hypothetical protein CROQUDRAFT_716373 [Cronartium quercuum f. sp. fusiforme G11]
MKGLLVWISVAVLLGHSGGHPDGGPKTTPDGIQSVNAPGSNTNSSVVTQDNNSRDSQGKTSSLGDISSGAAASAVASPTHITDVGKSAGTAAPIGNAQNSASTDSGAAPNDLAGNSTGVSVPNQNSPPGVAFSSGGTTGGANATTSPAVAGTNTASASSNQLSNTQGSLNSTEGTTDLQALNATSSTTDLEDSSGAFDGSQSLNATQGGGGALSMTSSTAPSSNSSIPSATNMSDTTYFAVNSTANLSSGQSPNTTNSTTIAPTETSLNSTSLTNNSQNLTQKDSSSSSHEFYYMDQNINWHGKEFKVYDRNADTVYIVTSKDGEKGDDFVIKSTSTGQIEFSANAKSGKCGYRQTYVAQDGSMFKINPRNIYSDRWYITGGAVGNATYEVKRNALDMAGKIYAPSGKVVAEIGHKMHTKEDMIDTSSSSTLGHASKSSLTGPVGQVPIGENTLVPDSSNVTSFNSNTTSSYPNNQTALNTTLSVGASSNQALLSMNSTMNAQTSGNSFNVTGPIGNPSNQTSLSTGTSAPYENSSNSSASSESQTPTKAKSTSDDNGGNKIYALRSDGTIPARYLIALMVIGKERVAACGY